MFSNAMAFTYILLNLEWNPNFKKIAMRCAIGVHLDLHACAFGEHRAVKSFMQKREVFVV